MTISFKIYNDLFSEDVKKAYDYVEQKTNTVHYNTSYAWISTWWKAFQFCDEFGLSKKLWIISAEKKEKTVAILPLVTIKRNIMAIPGGGYTLLTILGDQWGATFESYIGELDLNETKELISFIRENLKYDILLFSHIPYGNNLLQIISHKILLSACPTAFIKNYNNFEEYSREIYSKKLRQNLRTGINHAKRDNYSITIRSTTLKETDFNIIRNISISKLKSGKHSIYLDKDKNKFVFDISKKIPGDVVLIECNNKPIAYRINFIINNEKFCFDASYDRDYYKYEAGIISVNESIKDSFARGISTHCEGTGMDTYKLKFIKSVKPIYLLAEVGNTLKGRLLFPIKLRRLREAEVDTKKQFDMLKKKYGFTIEA